MDTLSGQFCENPVCLMDTLSGQFCEKPVYLIDTLSSQFCEKPCLPHGYTLRSVLWKAPSAS